jgi:WhiB family redox-sensing transcriptional regulator
VTTTPAWFHADDRACIGKTSVMYAPGAHKDGTAAARAICNSPCPYLTQCRNHAHALAEPYGVWGGEGPRTRFANIRGHQLPAPKRRIAICGTTGGWRRHVDQGEPVCDDCKDAWNLYKRELRARHKAAAA